MQTVPRLINFFTPTHYELSLDLARASERNFGGTVTINGVLAAGQDHISLHAKDLKITSATIDGKSATWQLEKFDELQLHQADLHHGRHVIVIGFSGTITDAMHGMYPCYFEHDGTKQELIATQFESHHAREVFPCVDEPEAKATFEVLLTTTPDVTVLGNMPIKQSRQEGELLITSFERTPRMSSYLLAWVVGNLHKKTALTRGGVEVNVWATPAQPAETLDFALDIAARSIDFFDEYFGVKYPLVKSDHVALPDFSSGAMENWGLITYRESCLLADPKLTPENSKRMIATVIAHELSHQWFGNLVTMKWWNDLWLNESFANLMEYVAVDALHPEWRMWEEFATQEVTFALRRDAIDGVQSVQTEVNHPDEISSLFDPAIVYAKGGRLLNMIRRLIGDEAFREGLKRYFTKFSYQNTASDDLWGVFEDVSQQPIRELMNQWISQPGLPLVSLSRQQAAVSLTQQRFFVGEHQPSDTLWSIPLFANQPDLPDIFTTRQIDVSLTDNVQLNQGLGAHFVTHYDDQSRQALLKRARSGDLATLDKLCLLQDASLLTRAGIDSSASLLPLAMAFSDETNEKVFDMAAGLFAELRKFVDDDASARSQLKQLSATFARPTFDKLGWDQIRGESDDDRERRRTALSLMLYGEDELALQEAKNRFESTTLDDLSPELRPLIISAYVRHFETPEIVEQLFDTYRQTVSSDLQIDIAIGLTSTRCPSTTERILASIQDNQIIRPQDSARWFAYLIRTRDSRSMAWRWLRDNWQWVNTTFAGDKSYDDFIRYGASALLTQKELDEFRTFTKPLISEPALSRSIELGIREIDARVQLINRDSKSVKTAISDSISDK